MARLEGRAPIQKSEIMMNDNDMIRRGELHRRVDLFCAVMIGMGFTDFAARARQMVYEITRDIPVEAKPALDIEAIENGGKRWHGEDHRVVSVRWEPYKPDGQRQMKAKGRWQECKVSGDFHSWTNCDRPTDLRAEAAPDVGGKA